MSYFHTGIRTIIGAEAFHCPVRDGKEWDHLAMVIRHNFLSTKRGLADQFKESCQRERDAHIILNASLGITTRTLPSKL